MPGKRITEDQIKDVRRLLDGGATVPEASRATGISTASIWRILGPTGRPKAGKRAADKGSLELARQLLEAHPEMSYRQVAEAAGVSRSTLQRVHPEESIPVRKIRMREPASREVTKDDIEKAEAAVRGGATYAEVGRTLGFAATTIRRYVPLEVALSAEGRRRNRLLGIAAIVVEAIEANPPKKTGMPEDAMSAQEVFLKRDIEELRIILAEDPVVGVLADEELLAKLRAAVKERLEELDRAKKD
jgi:uncharacterized protein YerC